MRRVVPILWLLLCAPVAAHAGDRDIFQGVLQGVLGEIDRQQAIDADRQRRRTAADIDACFQGNEPACHRALQSPRLIPEGRRAIRDQLQAIAEQRAAHARAYEAFVADWTRCRDDGDVAACEAALTFPSQSDSDRNALLAWRQAAMDRAFAAAQREAERQAERAAQAAVPVAVPETVSTIVTASVATPAPAKSAVEPALLFLLAVTSLAAVVAWWTRSSPVGVQPGAFMPAGEPTLSPALHPAAPAAQIFELPMTGHFPTDVRRVLAG